VLLAVILGTALVSAPPAVGDSAPDLEWVTMNGAPIPGGWSSAGATVVAFFATWCQPCHRTLRELGTIRQTVGPGLRFLLVEAGDDAADIRRFLADHPLPDGAAVIRDPSGGVRERWGCQMYPTLFIVDRAGIIRYINHGWGDGSQAKYLRRVQRVLGGGPAVRPPSARTPPAAPDARPAARAAP
jgi:cytochrome c biogenesis protein CcmG/thiol:disulfide interchange protein DsbE